MARKYNLQVAEIQLGVAILNRCIALFMFATAELCCTNSVMDASRESSVVAGLYEQTARSPYKTKNWPAYNEALEVL
ncbi:hypothetical protein SAMN04488118_107154 [Epibacterium ulvae]|uniref:Uncharacterized protein n=1 Tax=Epibacterium ulvae TaxID=1156985 RepID=A0A1G5R1T9_9RHOB|nr:hypothetical protein SAMN04488118_107154 [Epibacterium ulvae]